MTTPVQDPFADPIIPPSTHPTVGSFRGRLIMITARKLETVNDSLNPGKTAERVTADVTVVDGRGPVPVVKGNPPQPTGQHLDGPDFTGVWIQSERIVQQLAAYVGTGRPVLGIIDTRNPGTAPGKGNPWGITAATPEQKQYAVQFLAQRTVGAAAAPTPAPQAAPAPVQYTPAAQVPVPAPVAVPQPAPAANPFAQQAPMQEPASNPFA